MSKRILLPALLGLALAPVMAVADSGPLILKRVMLSSGGVGYFEYAVEVDGDARLSLPVRRDQVDDVLKSLVAFDGKGGVGAVSLAGQQPLREVFRGLPFGESDVASISDLLARFKGAEVQVSGTRKARGRIVAVSEQVQSLPENGGTLITHRLTLLGEEGLVSLIVEDSEEIVFTDARINQQVGQALAALADHGQQDSRTLSIDLTGKGKRQVRLAYLAEAPLWKSSYRLTLPASGEQAALQGWAVLENLSGTDWKGVELTLLSGAPATYRQALYESYFATRPQAPVVDAAPLAPQADAGAYLKVPEPSDERQARTLVARERLAGDAPVPSSLPLPAPMPASLADEAIPDAAGLSAAQSEEAAAQVEFRLPRAVDLVAGETLMTPIIDRALPAEQVSWYQPQVNPLHPLASVKLKNDSDSGLPGGLVTLYRRGTDSRVAYVGDARLLPLPVGEERILPFALDQKMRIQKEARSEGSIASGRIVDGMLQLKIIDRLDTLYRIVAPQREGRTLIVEQPRRAGYELVEPKNEVSQSGDNWRVGVTLSAGQKRELQVREERSREERHQLADFDQASLLFYADNASLDEAQREALSRLAELAAKESEFKQSLDDLQAREGVLAQDSERARANLKAVAAGSDAHKRFLERLEKTERDIEALAKQRGELEGQRREAERARKQYIARLDL